MTTGRINQVASLVNVAALARRPRNREASSVDSDIENISAGRRAVLTNSPPEPTHTEHPKAHIAAREPTTTERCSVACQTACPSPLARCTRNLAVELSATSRDTIPLRQRESKHRDPKKAQAVHTGMSTMDTLRSRAPNHLVAN